MDKGKNLNQTDQAPSAGEPRSDSNGTRSAGSGGGSGASAGKVDLSTTPAEQFTSAIGSEVKQIVEQVFSERRNHYVISLARTLKSAINISEPQGKSEAAATWVEIESLSRLRSIVGGRFDNLKKRWVSAGFPLREHRGDKDSNFQVDSMGWIELSNWISKQGYEAELTPDRHDILFRIRSHGTA